MMCAGGGVNPSNPFAGTGPGTNFWPTSGLGPTGGPGGGQSPFMGRQWGGNSAGNAMPSQSGWMPGPNQPPAMGGGPSSPTPTGWASAAGLSSQVPPGLNGQMPPGLGGGMPPGLAQALQQLQGNGGQGMPGQAGWMPGPNQPPRVGGPGLGGPGDTRNLLQQQPMPMVPDLLRRRGPGMMR